MTAAACITLGLIHLVIWSRQRDAWANLLFALVALGTAVFTGFEIAMMRAQTPADFAFALRWIHVPGWIVILALAGFVRLYLKAGRNWLFWGICVTRTLSLGLNFLLGQNLNFWEVTGLRHVSFLGESVAIGVGVSNHWMLVGQTAYLLLLIFVVDATVTAWRRGDRRRAVVVGGGVIFFVLGATGETTLVLWQLVPWPFIGSLPALATIATMAYELTLDAQRAGQLSRELRESEARMTLAAEAANLGVWIRDLVTNEIWATDQWRTLFGFGKSEEISFDGLLEKLHPADREGVRQGLAKAFLGAGDYETEYRVVQPDGGVCWIVSRARVEFNSAGKAVRLCGVSIDITARKQAEEKFRLVVEASPMGIVLANSEGRIVLVNSQTETIFGYPRQELIGQAVDILLPERVRSAHPGHRMEFLAAPQSRMMGAGRELFGRRRDGSEFPVEIGLSPIQSMEGMLVLTAIVDITTRIRAELELAQQRSEVAHLGRVTTLGEISGSLAHELNQPLGAILANTEAAELHLQHPTPNLEEVRAILADIRKDDERAGEIIHGMRAFLRRREMEIQSIAVHQLASEAVRLVSADAMNRKVAIGLDIPASLPEVFGDRIHLQQVLVNLLVNGMDAMNQSPVPARRMTIRASRPDSAMVELAVSDAGSGIAPGDMNRVFEAFHTTKPGGLGLGLAICRSIVEAHGGTITFENNTDRGATVRIRLKARGAGEVMSDQWSVKQ